MDECTEGRTERYTAALAHFHRALEELVQADFAEAEDMDIVSTSIGAWVVAHEETILSGDGGARILSHALHSDGISPATALGLFRYGELAAPRWNRVIKEDLD